mmetsp:Transcript_18791/g.39739  ORF Transcript_18791/g.39739 Transcript_18791/m.39739 type:complete len:154 (-) Transcript_18791:1943-2404(-)
MESVERLCLPAICRCTSFLYRPSCAMRSSWRPRSMILPLLTTQMQSAPRTVDRRCATTTVVRSAISLSIASCTTCSDSASSADVASSRRSIFGSMRRARAMAMRCFCPPESLPPRIPTCVWYCCGRFSTMKECALALVAASSISCCVHPSTFP